MKRIFLIRRRRYLLRAAAVGLAVAALFPQGALARYDVQGSTAVNLYATDSVSAEDVHGLSATSGYVLSAADQAALEQATSTGVSVRRADDFTPPRGVSVASASTGSTVEWGEIAAFSVLGALGIAGLLLLAATVNRRGARVAHS